MSDLLNTKTNDGIVHNGNVSIGQPWKSPDKTIDRSMYNIPSGTFAAFNTSISGQYHGVGEFVNTGTP